jgi:tetratricopeptide (TPR) repeat protein
MNEIKIKPKREMNRPYITRAIFCFIWAFGALFIIFFVSFISGTNLFPFKNFIIFTLCAIPISSIYPFIIEKLGSGLGDILLGMLSNRTSLREQVSADLSQAKICKGKGQFKEGINITNEILKKFPEFPEAILLKAQMLWEGFENKDAALKNLEKVIELVQDDDPIRRWAINYYYDLKKGQKTKG